MRLYDFATRTAGLQIDVVKDRHKLSFWGRDIANANTRKDCFVL